MNLPRLTLTDAEHERVTRLRNNVNLWLAYLMLVAIGAAGAMVVISWAIRIAIRLLPR